MLDRGSRGMLVPLVILSLSSLVAGAVNPRWLEDVEQIPPPDTPQVTDVLAEYATVRLSLSLWDPQAISGDELKDIVEDPEVRNGVVRSLEQVLCTVSDTRVISRAAALFDASLLDEYDACVQIFGHSRNSQVERQVSILQTKPQIEIVQVTRFGTIWSLWSVSWTTLKVGDLYVSEAIMNNPYVPITEVEELAVQAMENVAQLSLNINIVEDDFNQLLRENLRSRRLYASVTSDEIETFASAALDYRDRFTYNPRGWYPLRIWGVSLLFGYSGLVGVLMLIAGCRRRWLDQKGRAPQEVVNLGSAEYVDDLLLHSPSSTLVPRSMSRTGLHQTLSFDESDTDGTPSLVSSLGAPYAGTEEIPAKNESKSWFSMLHG